MTSFPIPKGNWNGDIVDALNELAGMNSGGSSGSLIKGMCDVYLGTGWQSRLGTLPIIDPTDQQGYGAQISIVMPPALYVPGTDLTDIYVSPTIPIKVSWVDLYISDLEGQRLISYRAGMNQLPLINGPDEARNLQADEVNGSLLVSNSAFELREDGSFSLTVLTEGVYIISLDFQAIPAPLN